MITAMIYMLSFLLRYIWRDSNLDDDNEKKWTWVLVIFSLWPQYQAYKLVKRIFNAQRSGIYCDKEDLKRQGQVLKLEQNLSDESYNGAYVGIQTMNDHLFMIF